MGTQGNQSKKKLFVSKPHLLNSTVLCRCMIIFEAVSFLLKAKSSLSFDTSHSHARQRGLSERYSGKYPIWSKRHRLARPHSLDSDALVALQLKLLPMQRWCQERRSDLADVRTIFVVLMLFRIDQFLIGGSNKR